MSRHIESSLSCIHVQENGDSCTHHTRIDTLHISLFDWICYHTFGFVSFAIVLALTVPSSAWAYPPDPLSNFGYPNIQHLDRRLNRHRERHHAPVKCPQPYAQGYRIKTVTSIMNAMTVQLQCCDVYWSICMWLLWSIDRKDLQGGMPKSPSCCPCLFACKTYLSIPTQNNKAATKDAY